ncbi:hypothetical protein [Streptomyces sp. NBC_00076]|uniref:hypothetical protein n=1 Tax=Streptomyces sp. NBC_00076 TaxID=2975642 RepID=UPI00324ECAF2
MRRLVSQLVYCVRLFAGPTGRHRAPLLPSRGQPPRASRSATTLPALSRLAPTVRHWRTPIDGTSTALVRPYLAAHEREEQARLQRLRRGALWCATYGVDLDLRDIHAVLGAAS